MEEEYTWDILLPRHTLEEALGEELAKQYRLRRGDSCIYMPVRNSTDWLCTCGAVNPLDEEECVACGLKPELLDRQVLDQLREEAAQRLEQEAAQRAREEEQRLAQEALARKQKRRRKALRLAAVTGALAVCAVAVWAVIRFAVPAWHYERAQKALREKAYQLAHREFSLAGDYRDAQEQLSRFYTPVLTQHTTGKSGESMIRYTYDADGYRVKTEEELSSEPDRRYVYVRRYDAQGRLLETQDWYNRTLYEYNERGDVITEEQYRKDGQHDRSRFYSYVYDERGRTVQIVEICSEHITVNYSYELTNQYTYDDWDRVVEQITEINFPAAVESSYRSVTQRRYDAQGREVETTVTVKGLAVQDPDSVQKETYSYDSLGRLTERRYVKSYDIDRERNTVQTYTCTYNSRGDVLREVTASSFPNHTKRDNVSQRTCTYDKEGRLLEDVTELEYADPEWNSLSGHRSAQTFTYDAQGRLVKETRAWEHPEEEHSTLETCEYTYGMDGMLKSAKRVTETYSHTAQTSVTYNENGLPQREVYRDKRDQTQTEYTYAYFYFPEGTQKPDEAAYVTLYG